MKNKVIFILICSIFLSFNLESQEGQLFQTKSRKAGPFKLGKEKVIGVSAVIDKVFRPKSQYDYPVTDNCVRFFNRQRKLIFKIDHPQKYCETVEYSLYQLKIPDVGYTILLTWDCEPSYPGTGAEAQLFGLSPKQQIVTLTSVMHPHADGAGPGYYEPVRVDLSKTQKNVPCFKVTRSVGYFEIPTYYEIHLGGINDKDESPHYVDNTAISIDYSTEELKDNTQIKLYSIIDGTAQNATILKITQTSKIEFIDATFRDDWWLRVHIDGHDGYVHTHDDFETLGLRYQD
jgi:hypothetical protein